MEDWPKDAHQLIAMLIDRLGGITTVLDTELNTGVNRKWTLERNEQDNGYIMTS